MGTAILTLDMPFMYLTPRIKRLIKTLSIQIYQILNFSAIFNNSVA